jgi:phosphate:Na+ symporter
MDIFDFLTMLGGLSLFLFGMNIMGQALERRAGGRLESLLGRLTTNRFFGLLTGLGVTAVIQSSSATTVMVVGFVNSGLMTLKQAINVIMGANVGTTVTAWILSLAGIDSKNFFVKLLKPSSFAPVLGLVGIILYMFVRNEKKRDTGLILLGFSTLMTGMETMSGAVSGLRSLPWFSGLFLMFQNPLPGVAAGAVLTAIIQSSSASVGILQALASTGQVTYGAAIPIIMGQNIGTCVTAMLSSVGANKNAKRAALVHLSFNVIGTAVWLMVFIGIKLVFAPVFLDEPASLFGIAAAHTVFNALCTLLLFPMAGLLEKLVISLVLDNAQPEIPAKLDERLLLTPAVALERCHEVAAEMAHAAALALKESIASLFNFSPSCAASIRKKEEKTDRYEDLLGTYLVKLSARQRNSAESEEAARLLKMIGDFERIADHAVNLLESAEEMEQKKLTFTGEAVEELRLLTSAVEEILDLSLDAFINRDATAASGVEPLEQVIDTLKDQLRTRHILRLQHGNCTMETGFVWSDLLTDLERTADHCSNIAGNLPDASHQHPKKKDSEGFCEQYERYARKYSLTDDDQL